MYSAKLKAAAIDAHLESRSEDSIVCLDSELRQVISNLVSNAMDAMKGQPGRLTIRVQNSVQWWTDRNGVAIVVSDSGRGMSEETQARLFEAFYTTKQDHGTGLGLWLSQEIIARHHGCLTFRTREGAGTVFRLVLPFQPANPSGEQ